MIRPKTIASPSGAADYYAKDNYYTADEGQAMSAWEGEGAAALGLTGHVDAQTFSKILSGCLPDGSVIDARQGEHRAGLDVTFSVSKSLSLVALLGGDDRIVAAIRASVTATLAWAEKNLAEARGMEGGRQVGMRTDNLVIATFLHDVNRNGEPQLHVHAIVANATRRPDGQWRAMRNDPFFDRQTVLGTVHNADLRARIEALGYRTETANNPTAGSFEIAGVPRATIEAFSTRSAEIRAALETTGRGSARERDIAALSTRAAKTPDLAADKRGSEWAALAAVVGFDARTLVEQAMARGERRETMWSRVVEGVRGVGARGMALAAAMGISPRDGDPLVPERLGRLDPRAFAAAQVVASASRELSEREAAFERFDLIGAALERGGPVLVGDVEARIGLLEQKGLLIGDGGRLVTTETTVRAEQAMLNMAAQGRGQVAPVLDAVSAAVRVQQAASELGLRRLNPAQAKAATLILSSADRVVVVQGVPGAGKSAALAPAAHVVKAEGRAVLGLAIASTIAAQLKRDISTDSMTIAGFIGRYKQILDGTASPAHFARARADNAGAILLVDESSQIGTNQMTALIGIANRLEVGRLALIGDTRQLGAVEAGKPFAQLQANGHAVAEMPENLRARSPMMKAVAALLNKGDMAEVFARLQPVTHEVPRNTVPAKAAAMWAALPPEERDATLMLSSGRAMRSEANQAAQGQLKAMGEIGPDAHRFEVFDRVTVTREAARDLRAYREGRVVEVRTNLPSQRLTRGQIGVIVSSEKGVVRLAMRDGSERLFKPGQLPRNLDHDAVSVHAVKAIDLHEGDRIRWTARDPARDLLNAGLAKVEAIRDGMVTVSSLADGIAHELPRGDRMLERFDIAYALNAHIAQGVTTPHGIVMMSAGEPKLASAKTLLVAMTRIADKATLIVDSGRNLERAVVRNPGAKTSALDVARQVPEKNLSLDGPSGGRERSRDFGIEM